MPVDAFFLDADGSAGGQRFCLLHPAQGGEKRGMVLYVHPFAEEMNKARRMAALQSRALAEKGFDVLQIDLHGCGDSSGDFGDASWRSWIDDVVLGARWLLRRAEAPLWLWGLRVGCLLCVEAAKELPAARRFLFWQPSAVDKASLQQFLRLKAAADMLSGDAKGLTTALRSELAAGAPVEIAGYALSPPLASGLERATLRPPSTGARAAWLEIDSRPGATLSPAAEQAIESWRLAGCVIDSAVVQGPTFWQTTEIDEAPRLIAKTLDMLGEHVPA